MNSWCKVVDGKVVDGPRAWPDAVPPDATWLPHSLQETPNTPYDVFVGSHHEVFADKVVEVKDYRPKTDDEVQEELNQIKNLAQMEIDEADKKIANGENVAAWEEYKALWVPYLTVTELGAYTWPSKPQE